jgi:hypothetical protein
VRKLVAIFGLLQEGRPHRLERMLPALAGGSVTVVGLLLLVQVAKTWS